MYLVETPHTTVRIDDLGITVGRDSPVWITSDQFQGSSCVKQLQRMGMVRVVEKERSRVERSRVRAPKKARKPVPAPRTAPPQAMPTLPVPRPIVQQGMSPKDASALARQVARETAALMLEGFQVPARTEPDLLSGLEQRLEQRLEQLVHRAASASSGELVPTRSGIDGPEEPVFIPEGIVKADGESPQIKVESESTSDGGLAAASAALRKAQKKGKS